MKYVYQVPQLTNACRKKVNIFEKLSFFKKKYYFIDVLKVGFCSLKKLNSKFRNIILAPI